jgi:hypothetical protein
VDAIEEQVVAMPISARMTRPMAVEMGESVGVPLEMPTWRNAMGLAPTSKSDGR